MADRPIPFRTLEALVAEVAWRLDHGAADRVAELFTETGAFVSPLATLTGRAELAAGFGMRARQSHTTRHVHSNLRCVRDGDAVLGTSILTVYRHDGDGPGTPRPFLVGDCEDRFACDAGDTWRIAERRIVPVFLNLPRAVS